MAAVEVLHQAAHCMTHLEVDHQACREVLQVEVRCCSMVFGSHQLRKILQRAVVVLLHVEKPVLREQACGEHHWQCVAVW